ncbi:MAG TPA: hypothetical protein VH440_02370 [Candidatus Limnocylindrales bacterium]|jgi:hypothetical protein
MLASDAAAAASTWRPQLFGDRRAAEIDDPLVEPLWTGPRALAYVADDEARLTDVDGDPIEGRDDVLAELVEAAGGSTVLLEGVLTPEPLQATAVIAAREELAIPRATSTVGAMIVGERSGRKDRFQSRAEEAKQRSTSDLRVPAALVVVDLLWLDDESICDVPLLERRRILESVLPESELVRLGVFVKPPIDPWLGGWRAIGFNRLAYKGANSRYTPGQKNRDWATAEIPRR